MAVSAQAENPDEQPMIVPRCVELISAQASEACSTLTTLALQGKETGSITRKDGDGNDWFIVAIGNNYLTIDVTKFEGIRRLVKKVEVRDLMSAECISYTKEVATKDPEAVISEALNLFAPPLAEPLPAVDPIGPVGTVSQFI